MLSVIAELKSEGSGWSQAQGLAETFKMNMLANMNQEYKSRS